MRSSASPAFSTAPATISCRAWRPRRLPFDVCLTEAQRLGYAEADPTFDIGGFDTAHKLAILASLAFGSKIDAAAVSVEGIEFDHARRSRRRGRTRLPHQAARRRRADAARRRAARPSDDGRRRARRSPRRWASSTRCRSTATRSASLRWSGPGAGGDATASAVAADIVDIARGTRLPTFGRPSASLVDADRVPMQRHEGGYYVRLAVVDRPGAMGAIAPRMGERMISLEAIMQKRASKEAAAAGVVPVVLMTHGTTEASIRDALAHAVKTASCARSRRSSASSARRFDARRARSRTRRPDASAAEDRRMRIFAIALMCGAMLCFTGLDTSSKWLGRGLPIAEIVWARYAGARADRASRSRGRGRARAVLRVEAALAAGAALAPPAWFDGVRRGRAAAVAARRDRRRSAFSRRSS